MQGMNDHDFDAFFQQAAEQHRVPYKPGAWEKMRSKLNQAKGKNGLSVWRITGLGLLLLLILLIGTGIWFQASTSEPETAEVANKLEKAFGEEANNPATTSKKSVEPTISDELGREESAEITQQQSLSTVEDEPASNGTFYFQPAQESSSTLMHPNGISYLVCNPIQDEASTTVLTSVLPLFPDSNQYSALPEPEQAATLVARWRIGFGVSPDVSAINLGETSQVGSKAAIGLEYFILPRLSIQTGVIFSNKLYEATGESYKPYPGYWKKYPVPKSIDAQCDVLDIPINLRYYAVNFPRSRVFISGGVSSYLMLTEDYVYNYPGGYGQKPSTYKYSERNENRHYFKVANVSLGYERLLSKRWALQVEPFVKMPVAGVGFGNIKLSTTGVFVSLNYQLR